MVRAARATMAQSSLLLLWPCLVLVATIFILNTLCDGLQFWLDPHGATRGLWRRRAVALPAVSGATQGAALSVEGLTLELDTAGGTVRPVREVSLSVAAGETLALVGESGSGKSLTGLAVLGLLPPVVRPVGGSVWLADEELLRLPERAMRRKRGGALSMVFQDPASSLNPVHRVGEQIGEAIRAHAGRRSVVDLLTEVGIPDPARRADAYPHQLSGGMRQRVMIAMAIANNPRVLIADEPTTALDVTVQAQVVDLLAGLQRQHGMGLIFITHNLPLVAEIAGRVAVMYAGEIVEQGRTDALFANPLHPYTRALLRSTVAEDGRAAPEDIPGSVPAPSALPPGPALRRRMQLVFQDPYASLDPRRRVGAQIADGLVIHRIGPRGEHPARVAALLEQVGLEPAHAGRFPHEFSGGQRQRIGIARALAPGPDLLVADEPVSALDVSVQAQVLALLADLRARLGVALLFISHDLAVVRHLCDRVAVMYLGRVVEEGPSALLFAAPRHPYTRALLSASPQLDPAHRRTRINLPGEPPSPMAPPSGCVFRTRCSLAMAACADAVPAWRELGGGHRVACIREEIVPC